VFSVCGSSHCRTHGRKTRNSNIEIRNNLKIQSFKLQKLGVAGEPWISGLFGIYFELWISCFGFAFCALRVFAAKLLFFGKCAYAIFGPVYSRIYKPPFIRSVT
jgi:hypothetical protein